MAIQAVKIERDEFGYWTHPELPEWDEGTSKDEIEAWFSAQSLSYSISYLENGDDEVAEAKYFDENDPDISNWNPTPPHADAILLSIHDTEIGPVAVWAVQIEQAQALNVD